MREKLAALRREVADGARPANDRITVAQYLHDWLTSKRNAVKPRTWHRYEGMARLHVNPALGNVRLAKLAPEDLDRLYADLLASGLSPTTAGHLHAMLHGALKQAVRRGVVPRNVTDFVDRPRAQRPEIFALSTPRKPAPSLPPRQLIRSRRCTSWHSRLDCGKASCLRCAGVMSISAPARCRCEARCNEGMTRARDTRAENQVFGRLVQLSLLEAEALGRHRARQADQRRAAGAAWDERGLVFTNEIGRPINASNLWGRSFQPLLERAGIAGLRFHDLRHSAATLLLGQNVHPKVVSEMLGHADVGITLDVYSHVTPTMHAHAASAFDTLLGEPDKDLVAVSLAVTGVAGPT